MRESFPTADTPPEGGDFVALDEAAELPLEERVEGYGDTAIINEEVSVIDGEPDAPPMTQREFLDGEHAKHSMSLSAQLEGSMGEIAVRPNEERNVFVSGIVGDKHAIAVSARMPSGMRKGVVQSFSNTDSNAVAAHINFAGAEDKWAVILAPGKTVEGEDDGSSEPQLIDPEQAAYVQAKIFKQLGHDTIVKVVSYDAAAPAPTNNDGVRGVIMIEFGADNTTQIRVNDAVLPHPRQAQEE